MQVSIPALFAGEIVGFTWSPAPLPSLIVSLARDRAEMLRMPDSQCRGYRCTPPALLAECCFLVHGRQDGFERFRQRLIIFLILIGLLLERFAL
jgi:hypothetical protein